MQIWNLCTSSNSIRDERPGTFTTLEGSINIKQHLSKGAEGAGRSGALDNKEFIDVGVHEFIFSSTPALLDERRDTWPDERSCCYLAVRSMRLTTTIKPSNTANKDSHFSHFSIKFAFLNVYKDYLQP